jgi:asparagine synthase (glutamine-hydrolysing)
MCGIAGFNFYDKKSAENTKKVLKRRGPDQDGIYSMNNVTLVHTRLAVIDVENGLQPMNKNGVTLVYNGELYNTEELRSKLYLLGQTFDENSDTEVILKAYLQWGTDCVNHFNGIFAFAISDGEKIFIARDRMGVKPFFYYKDDEKFLFASEIKALLSNDYIKPEIDSTSLMELILIGPGRTPGYGVFKNIKELEKGCCGVFENNKLKTWEYWSPKIYEHKDNLETTIEKVRFLVNDSIRRQTVSDVPLCCFLSGGLDSSIISAVTADVLRKKGEQLHTFSVDYEDNRKYFQETVFQPNTDSDFINYMTEHINSVHHNIILKTEDVVSALYTSVDARDLPGMSDVDSSLLLFCKEVKKDFTVALSGECSDEIFGGYPWFRNKKIRNTDGFPWSQSTAYRAGFLKEEYINSDTTAYVYDKYKATVNLAKGDRFREMTRLNLDWFMQTLLDRKDRMSMYNGLEVRVPFCDYRLVEYTYNIPWEFKDYKNYEKGLLREAVKDLLPEQVLWRKKSPYPKTHNPLYLKMVSEQLKDVITGGGAILQFIKKDALEQLLKTSPKAFTEHNWYGQLMSLPQTIAYFLQFNYWLEKYKVIYTGVNL